MMMMMKNGRVQEQKWDFFSNEIYLMKRELVIVSICKKQRLVFDENDSNFLMPTKESQ